MYRWSFLLFVLLLIDPAASCPFRCTCRNDRLDCSRRGLTSFPANIPYNIRTIDISGNNLEFLNASFIPRSITSINASDNRLQQVDDDILYFSELVHLNLKKNQLKYIPKFHASLERLDLSSNLIENLTKHDVLAISTVRFVDLSRNRLTTLPSTRPVKESNLEKLDLAANHIRTLPDDAFQAFPHINSLRLFRNKLQILERNTFRGLRHLELLDVGRNHLKAIPALAFEIPSLVELNLSKNRLHSLEDGTFFGCESLQNLNISHNHISIISDGWLYGLEQLQSLDLSYNQVNSFDPNIWNQCQNLRLLSLEHNLLRSLPSGAFRLLPFLEHLNLASNSIQNLHKTALTGLDSLKTLDISSNALAVCVEDEAVLYNTSMPFLRSLKFASNQLKIVPSRAFARFPALEELDLTDNPIATLYPSAFEPLRLKKLIMTSSSLLCDCHMSWFSQWFSSSRLDRRDVQLQCVYPKPLEGINVLFIDIANLTCLDDSPRARVTLQPELVVRVTVGQTATFKCHGYGHGNLTYEWRIIENGKPRILVEDSTTRIFEEQTVVFNGSVTGQMLLQTTLQLFDITLQDRAEYQCAISNQFAKDYSIRSQLEVNQAPVFQHEPDDMSLLVGQNAKIMCAATGVPTPVLYWSKDGDQSFPAAFERRLHVRPNDDHLYVLNVTMADQGVYTCHVSNAAGSAQASATLRIYQNKFRHTLNDRQIVEGETVVLDCLADISPNQQRIEWKKNGKSLSSDDSRIIMKADQQILVLTKTQASDSGEFTCEMWAGADLLDRQHARLEIINKTNNQFSTKANSRSRRWLPVSLMAFSFFGLSLCIFCSLFCFPQERQRISTPVKVDSLETS